MVHYIALYKLQDHVEDEKIEEMIRGCRSLLFRVHEVHNVRSGKRIEEDMEYPFFVAIDFESLDKLEMFRDDPLQVKFDQEVIKPNTAECVEMIYETEPGKNVKYSEEGPGSTLEKNSGTGTAWRRPHVIAPDPLDTSIELCYGEGARWLTEQAKKIPKKMNPQPKEAKK